MTVAASIAGCRRALLALACALLAATAAAGERCRIAFDIGSSGIRAGASNSGATAHADIDYLAPLWQGRGLEETVAPTIAALHQLPANVGFDSDCARIGGGFSAWRLALQQDSEALAAMLTRIRTATDVAVLVVPQAAEGAYGYFGARQLLGDKLNTSHVLDIGGGSLQIAGGRTSFGAALGQKLWHQRLCASLRRSTAAPCALQPMTAAEVADARALLQKTLADVRAALPERVTMTAISRPVTRGVLPAIERLQHEKVRTDGLPASAVTAAIDRLASLTPNETAALIGNPARYVAYLLSDMLLVEGLLQATGGDHLQVAELDSTNLPGLLADDRAFEWGRNYACYLDRLRRLGVDAYASDPATCPAATRP